jgi:hypothetical protein
MKWVAVSVLALSALCGPATVLHAEEDPFMAGAAASVQGFGEAFRAQCFERRPPDAGPLWVAVEELQAKGKLSDEVAQTVTDRIEAVLENEFKIAPRRLRAELGASRKDMGEKGPEGPAVRLDGIITLGVEADQQGNPVVRVFAWTTDLQCKLDARKPISTAGIKDAIDNPEAFFRLAARKLDVRQVERLVAMPPQIGIGFSNAIVSHALVRQLQEQLVTAIRSEFADQRRSRLSETPPPPAGLFGDGPSVPDLAGAWRARLRLGRTARGIDVHVEFTSPDSPSRIVDVPGHFAKELLPDFEKPVLTVRATKPIFKVKEDPLDIEVEVMRPSRLFCFFLEASGEATLLFPTFSKNKNWFGASGGKPLHFAKDFWGRTVPLTTAGDYFFDCIATKYDPSVLTLWLDNTIEARKGRGQDGGIKADLTLKILTELRGSEDAAEAMTEIVSR